MKDEYSLYFDLCFFFFRTLQEKKREISLLNELQPIIMVFFTLINKFSDRDKNKVKLVTFLENLKNFGVVLTNHS